MPLPPWATAPRRQLGEYLEQEIDVVHAATFGLNRAVNAGDQDEAFWNLEVALRPLDDQTVTDSELVAAKDKIAHSHKVAAMARREVEQNFPILLAHAAVAFWGAIEAYVEDVATAVLTNDPQAALLSDRVAGMKVPVSEFVKMTPEDRARWLVTRVSEDGRGPLTAGEHIR